MCAVTVEGMRMATSASGASVPPVAPVSAITASPTSWARPAARTTLAELPLVEMPRSTSPAAPKDSDLSLEHTLDAVVVRDGGEQRGVGREGDRRDRGPGVVEREGADELRGKVLGVGGAAPVPTDQELVASAEGGGQQHGGCGDIVPAVLSHLAHEDGGVPQVALRGVACGVQVHLSSLPDERGDDSPRGLEVRGHVIGGDPFREGRPSLARADEHGGRADPSPRLDVGAFVPDEERGCEIQVQVARGIEEQTGFGLTATTGVAGVVGAAVDGVDLGGVRGEEHHGAAC